MQCIYDEWEYGAEEDFVLLASALYHLKGIFMKLEERLSQDAIYDPSKTQNCFLQWINIICFLVPNLQSFNTLPCWHPGGVVIISKRPSQISLWSSKIVSLSGLIQHLWLNKIQCQQIGLRADLSQLEVILVKFSLCRCICHYTLELLEYTVLHCSHTCTQWQSCPSKWATFFSSLSLCHRVLEAMKRPLWCQAWQVSLPSTIPHCRKSVILWMLHVQGPPWREFKTYALWVHQQVFLRDAY